MHIRPRIHIGDRKTAPGVDILKGCALQPVRQYRVKHTSVSIINLRAVAYSVSWRVERVTAMSRRPETHHAALADRNRCETVIWLHNPNATSKSNSTFGLIQVAASLRPNAQHQPQGTRTACLQTFWARSGRIGQLPCAERIGSKHTINARKQQITQTTCV